MRFRAITLIVRYYKYNISIIIISNINLLYKIEWFIDFSATNKIDNLTCVIIYDNLTCVDYHETH